MLLGTIETIKLLLENAVEYEKKILEDLENEFKNKYGSAWKEKISKMEEDQLIQKQEKYFDMDNILDDFMYHDWR